MKNSVDQGGCYPQRSKAEVDNTLRDLQNSSYPTKAEFNNCFIIHSKYFPVLNGVSPFRSLFFCSPKSQFRPQVFSVNGWIICSGLHFWRHFDVNGWIICSGLHFWRHWLNMTKILSKFGEQQLVMVNYACGFNQSETGKYFEWIIILIIDYSLPLIGENQWLINCFAIDWLTFFPNSHLLLIDLATLI